MGLKIWVVNLILAMFAAVCAIQAYGVWSREAKHASNAPVAQKAPAPAAKKAAGREAPPESDFETVAVKNLFSAERKEIEPEPETSAEDADADKDNKEEKEKADDLKADGKKMYLYGVVITDGYQAALITNPNWKTDKKDQTWVRLGDIVEGFKVAAIETERVVLLSGGNEVEMFLYDKSKPRTAPKPAAAAPVKTSAKKEVVTTGRKPTMPRATGSGRASPARNAAVAPPAIQMSESDQKMKSLQEKLKQRGTPQMPQGYGKFYTGKK